jgi:hypothetical protein
MKSGVPQIAADLLQCPSRQPWASARSRCAPARCAGARAEGPAACRENSDSRVARSTRSTSIVGVQRMIKQPDHLGARTLMSHIPDEPHRRHPKRNDKNCLDEYHKPVCFECAEETFARKRLIHAMPLNKDRSINRAMVVGCAISATRNYLKLHMLKTLNPLLCNIHAETRKLWKPSAMQIAALRPATGLPCMHTCTSSGSAVAPTIEGIGHMQSP